MKSAFLLLELLDSRKHVDDPALMRIELLKSTASSVGAGLHVLTASEDLPCEFENCTYAVLCGSASPEGLRHKSAELRAMGVWPIIATDAFLDSASLKTEFDRLESNLFQLAKTEGIVATLKSGRKFIYAYGKPDCSSTVCLLFDEGKSALVIERLHDPFAGSNAFPGGFLRIQLEDMETCAYRELEEECSIKLNSGELKFIDLRSCPDRDPRAHVIDAGYAALLSAERKQEILEQLKAGDDAARAQLMPVTALLKEGALAFDHRELLSKTLAYFGASTQAD